MRSGDGFPVCDGVAMFSPVLCDRRVRLTSRPEVPPLYIGAVVRRLKVACLKVEGWARARHIRRLISDRDLRFLRKILEVQILGSTRVYPRCFFEECARRLFCLGCGSTLFGSVEVIESKAVAGSRR